MTIYDYATAFCLGVSLAHGIERIFWGLHLTNKIFGLIILVVSIVATVGLFYM